MLMCVLFVIVFSCVVVLSGVDVLCVFVAVTGPFLCDAVVCVVLLSMCCFVVFALVLALLALFVVVVCGFRLCCFVCVCVLFCCVLCAADGCVCARCFGKRVDGCVVCCCCFFDACSVCVFCNLSVFACLLCVLFVVWVRMFYIRVCFYVFACACLCYRFMIRFGLKSRWCDCYGYFVCFGDCCFRKCCCFHAGCLSCVWVPSLGLL